MFRGATKVTLDAKGRMAIPTRYRERLQSRCDSQLVMTIDQDDHCLLVFPQPDWEDLERKLSRLPSLNKRARRMNRLMVGHATDVELDGHGRILVSRELREFANLDRQAMLVGQTNKFELWDESTWIEKRELWMAADDDDVNDSEPMPDDMANLSF